VLAAAGALGIGTYRVLRPGKSVTPTQPTAVVRPPNGNGRKPVEETPRNGKGERRPADMLPGETVQAYEQRLARERAALEAAKQKPVEKKSTEIQKFYPEKKSQEYVQQYIAFLQRAKQPIRTINWEKPLWSPESGQPFTSFIKDNNVLRVTRTVQENGTAVKQSMFILIQPIPGTDEYNFSIAGPLSKSPDLTTYAGGMEFPGDLNGALSYLGNPTVTGVFGPAQ
jgi:hypothetical protein